MSSKSRPLEDWEAHVCHDTQHGRTYCGIGVNSMAFHLTGADHARACVDTNSYVQPCPACWLVINDAKVSDDSKPPIDPISNFITKCADEIERVHGQTMLDMPDSPQPERDYSLAIGSYLPRRPNGFRIFVRTSVDLTTGKVLP